MGKHQASKPHSSSVLASTGTPTLTWLSDSHATANPFTCNDPLQLKFSGGNPQDYYSFEYPTNMIHNSTGDELARAAFLYKTDDNGEFIAEYNSNGCENEFGKYYLGSLPSGTYKITVRYWNNLTVLASATLTID